MRIWWCGNIHISKIFDEHEFGEIKCKILKVHNDLRECGCTDFEHLYTNSHLSAEKMKEIASNDKKNWMLSAVF